MTVKIPPLLLLVLLTLMTDVCSQRPSQIYIKAGELVALRCPLDRRSNHGEAKVIWTSNTTRKIDLTDSMSSAEQRQMQGVLVHGRSLVILSVSVNHQGNYACSLGNSSRLFRFRLTVYTTLTKEYEDKTTYTKSCYTQNSCTLNCPDVNTPAVNTLNITSNGIIWHKEGVLLPRAYYFPSVKQADQGVYTCTRSYLYHGQIYNRTFTVVLNVQPKKKFQSAKIISPKTGKVEVELGSPLVIDCEAVLYSEFDEVYWRSGTSFLETNDSLPVFYNLTRQNNKDEIHMKVSLIFKKVSAEDLSKNYSCRLESAYVAPGSVTITLVQKHVCSQRPSQIYIKAGELVALQCPLDRRSNHSEAKVVWTSNTTRKIDLTDSMSSAEQRQMQGVLVHGRSLVILSVSVNHQGNYACSLGNSSRLFRFGLTVYTTLTKEYEDNTTYTKSCYTQDSCTLNCPDVCTPAVNTLNITRNAIIWHKEGVLLPRAYYFPSVKQADQGVYTCTRSYLYHGQIYNRTFTVVLNVQPKDKFKQSAKIISPKTGKVEVELGSPLVIDCEAVLYSEFDEVYWHSGTSFLETNDSLPVFYNSSRQNNKDEIHMKVSLVFKKVSAEDLSKNYSCRLESTYVASGSVTITLVQKPSPPSPSYISLGVGITCTVLVMALTVVIYVKFKIHITLFLRDTLGCYRGTSDEKSYDAFLMCYESNANAGLNEHDRKWLMTVLEETYGYSLCLFDRDVLPGNAVTDAVLDCINQSRAVVLVPTSSDSCPGSGLLSAIHAALVDRQTRLVFIKTETTEVLRSSALPETLQLLAEAGECVTWKGTSSMSPSSSFCKQLRYYLPPPEAVPKIKLLLRTN
uniref:interleukin-18 receptor accessory protein-like isoform X2 n=1 Tax=Scatophagus argus TaxID=75038 RepID=UPI001ED861BF|nr:interleukin-18 receptor accessory protein-like isoform X2 [Scatophagus argus]